MVVTPAENCANRGKNANSRYYFTSMTSLRTKSLGVVGCWRSLQVGGRALALVALLVGCSGGSGTTGGGGAGGGGGKGGAAGKTGSAGQGGGGSGGAAGSNAGATGTAGTGGATGTGGVAGAGGAGATAGVGGVGGAAAGGRGGAAGGVDAGDAGVVVAVDAGMHATDAGCQGVALPGSGVPAGTVVTASASLDSAHGPSAAVDQDFATDWTPGTSIGWITFTFPTPIMISAVRIQSDAYPANNEIFTVSTSASTATLGSATYSVPLWPGSVLPDIQITPGLYSNITVSINAGASWASIIELWFLATPACS